MNLHKDFFYREINRRIIAMLLIKIEILVRSWGLCNFKKNIMMNIVNKLLEKK